MDCRICKAETDQLFSKIIMGKYPVGYFRCRNCGYMQMGDLSHIDEAYTRSINNSDVGLLARNYRFAEQLAPFFYFSGICEGPFLDYGGGYGIFCRIMRDIGFDFRWYDKYTQNLFVPGYESGPTGDFSAITALEVFEHLAAPKAVLTELLQNTDTVVIGTNLIDSCRGNLEQWQYIGCDHGQHVGFFAAETMRYLAREFHLECYSDDRYLTILSKKKQNYFAVKQLKWRHRYSVLLLELVKYKMKSLIESDYETAINFHENTL